MKRFLKWFGVGRNSGTSADADSSTAVARKRPPAKQRTEPQKPELVDFSADSPGTIADGGPGKNVLIRNRYLREETGTHETLKIVDDSILESDDEQGFDPYNTGQFDRSKSWNNRTRK